MHHPEVALYSQGRFKLGLSSKLYLAVISLGFVLFLKKQSYKAVLCIPSLPTTTLCGIRNKTLTQKLKEKKKTESKDLVRMKHPRNKKTTDRE